MSSAAQKRIGAVASACLISSGISRRGRLRGVLELAVLLACHLQRTEACKVRRISAAGCGVRARVWLECGEVRCMWWVRDGVRRVGWDEACGVRVREPCATRPRLA